MHVKTERRLEQRLAEAEQRLSADELMIREQHATIGVRLRDGLDLGHAMTLLAKAERLRELHLKERDLLRDELAATATAADQEVNEPHDPHCRVTPSDAVYDHGTSNV